MGLIHKKKGSTWGCSLALTLIVSCPRDKWSTLKFGSYTLRAYGTAASGLKLCYQK